MKLNTKASKINRLSEIQRRMRIIDEMNYSHVESEIGEQIQTLIDWVDAHKIKGGRGLVIHFLEATLSADRTALHDGSGNNPHLMGCLNKTAFIDYCRASHREGQSFRASSAYDRLYQRFQNDCDVPSSVFRVLWERYEFLSGVRKYLPIYSILGISA